MDVREQVCRTPRKRGFLFPVHHLVQQLAQQVQRRLLALGITTGLYCGVPYATMTELMPAHVRSTGIALGYNVPVAVFGGSAPFIASWLINETGDVASPMYFFLLTAAIALVGVAMLRPTDLLGHEDVPVTGSIDAVGGKVTRTVAPRPKADAL